MTRPDPLERVAPDPRRRPAPAMQGRLYERDEYLAEIAGKLSCEWGRSGGAVVIEGYPWTGRSALLGAACRCAGEAEDFVVLRACGSDVEVDAPFGVVTQLLDPAAEPALARLPEEITSDPRLSAGRAPSQRALEARYAVLDGVLGELSARQRVLLAVDDANWSDPESAEWMRRLVRRHTDGSVQLILTMTPRHRGAPLTAVDRIAAEPSTQVLSLQPLSRRAIGALAGCVLVDSAGEKLLDALFELTSGCPLLVVAVADELAAERRRSDAPTDVLLDSLAPAAVGRALLRRLSRYPPETIALLEAIVVLGPDADLASSAQVAGIELAAASPLADHLVDDGLVSRWGSLRCVHRIVETVVAEQMGPSSRSKAHVTAARLLDAKGAPADEVALHLNVVEPVGDKWVAGRLQAAGHEALSRGDAAAARALLARAVVERPGESGPDLFLDLAVASLDVDSTSAARHLRHALELGADPGAAARVSLALWRTVADEPDHGGVGALLEQVAAQLGPGDSELRIELAVAVAELSTTTETVATARANVGELLAHSLAGTTPAERLGLALVAVSDSASVRRATAAEVAETAERALLPGELVGADASAMRLRARAVVALARAGRFGHAAELASAGLERAERIGHERAAAEYAVSLAAAVALEGRLGQAEAAARSALVAMAGRPWARRPDALATLCEVLAHQGRSAEALALIDEAHDGTRQSVLGSRVLLECRGGLLFATGRSAEALSDFELARREAERSAIDNPAVTTWRSGLAACLSELGRTAGARRLASENLTLARTFGAHWVVGSALLAQAAVLLPSARMAALCDAVELLEEAGAPILLATGLVELGSELARIGRATDARAAFRRGADVALRCGAIPLVDRAASELRRAGGRPRRLALTGPQALTPSERRVALLASEGCTNATIAATLFVAEKTVEGHLARVYRKLAIRSRRELRAKLAPVRAAAGSPWSAEASPPTGG